MDNARIIISNLSNIDEIGLSNRGNNALKRAGILKVKDLLETSNEDISSFRNVGAKTIAEITEIKARILTGDGFQYIGNEIIKAASDEKTIDDRLNSEKYPELNIPLKTLNLPERCKNCLDREGFQTVAEICTYTVKDFLQIRGMGVGSAETIIRMLKEAGYYREESRPMVNAANIDSDIQEVMDSIRGSRIKNFNEAELLSNLYQVRGKNPDAHHETFAFLAYQNPYILSTIEDYIMKQIEIGNGSVLKASLEDAMPDQIQNTTIFRRILAGLENENRIDIKDDVIFRDYPSIRKYAFQLDGKYKDILTRRLDGETLESIGSSYRVTRERIRQISTKVLAKRPARVKEDRFQYIFTTYDISAKDFSRIFEQPEYVGNYLEMTHEKRKNQKAFSEILEDELVSKELRLKAEKEIYAKYLKDGDVYISGYIGEVALYVLRNWNNEFRFVINPDKDSINAESDCYATAEDITKAIDSLYRMNGKELDNENEENRTGLNRLDRDIHVLHIENKRYRYYNIDEYDMNEFIDDLNLDQYQDVEISSALLFNRNRALMDEYDVRNANELHNLLKKTIPMYKPDLDIRFDRNPTIHFGNTDRDLQALNLMIEYAPISQQDLAEKYEETYGHAKLTVLANFLTNLNPYLHKGLYSIKQEIMPEKELDQFSKLLTNDFYTFDEVRQIYTNVLKGEDVKYINAYNLKRMRFRVYSNYLIRDTFDSAKSYFRHLLTAEDLVDTRGWKKNLYIQEYYSVLHELIENYEIVEFSPKQYINIRRLNGVGITKEKINEFCEKVADFVDKDRYFTVKVLRENELMQEFDDYGFDDCFYSSILSAYKATFSSQKYGKGTLLLKSDERTSSIGFITQLVSEENSGSKDIYDLIDEMNDTYGLSVPKDRIILTVDESPLYYNRIMERVYLNYETFLEEV